MIRRREYKNSGNYDLTVRATNTTNSVIQMNILGNPTYTNDIANQFIQYQWDITSFAFSIETTIYLQYRKVGASTYQLAVVQLPSQDTQGIVDALNSLNLASFYSSTSGGNTFINTYNDTYEFGILNIYYPSIIDPTFLYGNGFDNQTFVTAIQSDGKILVGGLFTSYNGISCGNIARLNPDGSLDTTFITGTGFDFSVNVIAIQTDGKILIGGLFSNYNGTPAPQIIRLNTDGTIDGTFVYGTGFGGFSTSAIAIQSDGKILVSGAFTGYNATPANKIIRLNSDGSVDGTFVYGTGFNSLPNDIKIQNDGKIVIVGLFTNYNGTPANGIIRLNPNGSVDGTFVYGAGFNIVVVNKIAIQNNGYIICVGNFTSYNGSSYNRIIRLDNFGSIDPTFNIGTGFNGILFDLTILSNGKIVVIGDYNDYNGVSLLRLARLNTDGSYDFTWNVGSGFNAQVFNLSLTNDNKIYVAGNYFQFDGVDANRIIRLLPS